MSQDKIQVAARIPKELHDACTTKYGNITNAIITGLNLSLAEATENDCLTNENVLQKRINDLEVEIKSNSNVIQELNEQIKINVENLKELTIKDASHTEMAINFKERIEEKNQYIDSLKRELEISQETHRNYMLQVQTLINQKAIDVPGVKKPWWQFW
jgi:chromosome segregation ATPase